MSLSSGTRVVGLVYLFILCLSLTALFGSTFSFEKSSSTDLPRGGRLLCAQPRFCTRPHRTTGWWKFAGGCSSRRAISAGLGGNTF